MKTLRFARRCCLAEMLVLLALFATPARAAQTSFCWLFHLIRNLARYEQIVRLKLLPRTAA